MPSINGTFEAVVWGLRPAMFISEKELRGRLLMILPWFNTCGMAGMELVAVELVG